MKLSFDSSKFDKQMKNIVNYSIGFLEGVDIGQSKFLDNLGKSTIEVLKQYIDSMARVDRELLHHMYEWDQTGSPDARLFDLNYTVSAAGLSINSTFRQSMSIQRGSTKPFYNKARIMEDGVPVRIRPRNSDVLAFETADGTQVFTPNEVVVQNPGGKTAGAYEKTLDSFINKYFTQSFLRSSGILDKLTNLSVYGKNLSAGAQTGKSRGRSIGYYWIADAGVMR